MAPYKTTERPLTPEDSECISHLASALPQAFALLDPDMIVAYIRTYTHAAQRLETTVKHVGNLLDWRARVDYSVADALRSPPPKRADFERLYQAGPIGRDSAGRVVVIERIGRIPALSLIHISEPTRPY